MVLDHYSCVLTCRDKRRQTHRKEQTTKETKAKAQRVHEGFDKCKGGYNKDKNKAAEAQEAYGNYCKSKGKEVAGNRTAVPYVT